MNLSDPPINKLTIVGGTHGNERTGVALLERWRQQPTLIQRPAFTTSTMLANPEAVAANKRYIDADLNRQFSQLLLRAEAVASTALETRLAQSINASLGPKGSSQPAADFILDLHTSTANMGINLVLIHEDPFHLQMAAYLQQQLPEAVITSEADLLADHHFLCSIAPRSLLIEIGPCPQGVMDHRTIAVTEEVVGHVLDFIQRLAEPDGKQWQEQLPERLTIYRYTEQCFLPRDQHGRIDGFVHQSLLGKDFQPLEQGQVLFERFDGTQIAYDNRDATTQYAAFINEAAYYDRGQGFCLCEKVSRSVPRDPA